jgi:hypothetical protein
MPLFINGPARHSSTKRSFRVAGYLLHDLSLPRSKGIVIGFWATA